MVAVVPFNLLHHIGERQASGFAVHAEALRLLAIGFDQFDDRGTGSDELGLGQAQFHLA